MEIELTNEDIKNTKIIYPEAKSTEQTPYQPRIPKRSYRWEPSLSQILNYDSVLMVRLVTEEVYRAELLNHADQTWILSRGYRHGLRDPKVVTQSQLMEFLSGPNIREAFRKV